MATFVNPLRLTELATGEGSGTWGTTTNTNLELIGEALGYGTQDCFASDADATTTIADGAVDPARALYFKVTSSATLTATRTLTIAPNTINRVMFIENATTGSQSITISQGSGTTVTVPSGSVKSLYLDGAGTGASAVEFSSADLTAVATNVLPNTDDNNDLGSASKRWADLYLSGGVYIGGTTSANYLDDYEKGTFTLNVPGSLLIDLVGTPSSYYAEYVKIGRTVHVFGQIIGTGLSIDSAGYLIFGSGCLPFATTTQGSSPIGDDTFTGVVGDGAGYGLTSAGSRVASVSAAYGTDWSWGPTSFSSLVIDAVCTYMTDS